ncbi:MAG: sel1 repeat family protein [Muribaculaceae bacterium]|nr:sel1 repeat family protein [Muribaculaceae bacterium]
MKKFFLCLISLLSLAALAQSEDSGRELYETAMKYETGNDSVAADIKQSLFYYRQAAEKGFLPAQNYLGFLYYNGEVTKQDVDSALYWITRAAEQGDLKAAGNLGYLYSKAPEIPRDYSKAFQWLSKAAEGGVPTSLTQLADLYKEGLGVEPDTLKAIELYEKAIHDRVSDAEYRLLAMMGYQWKKLSADSALNLGLHYYNTGAPVVAVDLFQNAAEVGNAKAMTLLGDAYSRSYGVAYNHDKSLEYFIRGAMGGDPSAQYVLAETLEIFPDLITPELIEDLYPEGLPLSIDEEKLSSPAYWYSRASLAGIADADTAFSRLLSP